MNEPKPPRDVPRHTIAPRSGGSVTIEPTVEAEPKKPKDAEAKKHKPAGDDSDA